MSKAQMLANLQILLNRVRTRAAEPRGHVAPAPAASVAPVAATAAASPTLAAPPAPAPTRVASEPAVITARGGAQDADVSVGTSTWSPPAGSDDVDVDVDVEIEVSESIPPEESLPPQEASAAPPVASPQEPPARTESESEERLVAAQPVSPVELPEPAQESYAAAADAERTPATPPDVAQTAAPSLPPEAAVASGVGVASAAGLPAPVDALPHDSWTPPATVPPPVAQAAPQTVPELEMDRGSGPAAADDASATIESAPASSRRPVEPEEQLADMAFGPAAPQPPRHTPPPESGRLPAAPPDEFDDVDVTGVRDATVLPAHEAEGASARAEPIVPEASRPVLSATGDVADLVGPPPRFVPKTFADLLEATLSL